MSGTGQLTISDFLDHEDDDGRWDCRNVYENFYFENSSEGDGDEPATAEYRCGSWACYCCGYRMRQNLVEEIDRVCGERPEMRRLLTLTLDPETAPDGDEQYQYLTSRWNALLTEMKDRFGDLSFIWVRENGESGDHPHLHMIIDRYIPQGWLSNVWERVGGGEVVDIRRIDHVDRAAHYIGKYLTKEALHDLPKGTRRYGSSQDIDLGVRGGGSDDPSQWSLLMVDEELRQVSGLEVSREPEPVDFVRQREWGGPVPPD